MAEDDEELDRLRARAGEDAELIAELRGQVDRARARDDAHEALISVLRRDADVHDAALLAIRDQLSTAEDELGDLRAIRDALTPAELPERPGLHLGVSFQAALSRVSGDFYLVVAGPGAATVLVVGDVEGKGIEAARDAAFLRTAFATSAQFSSDPCQLLQWANFAFAERVTATPRFATVACLAFDPASRTLRFALAGHPPPIWLGSGDELDGSIRTIPVGINKDFGCQSAALALDPGEGLLLYTDGLTEARNGTELFGTDRVREHVRAHGDRPTADLLNTLRLAAMDFSGGELTDDMCLVSLRAA